MNDLWLFMVVTEVVKMVTIVAFVWWLTKRR